METPKSSGGTRPLGIPTVTDRLIQQAIAQVLVPIFDPGFSDANYGFRPDRSAHGAVYKVREYIKERFRIVVDMDLSKFFDTVNHLEMRPYLSHSNRHDKSMAQGSWSDSCQRTVGEHSLPNYGPVI
ncbi:MAG: reverse transcriptase domain-containing protein [Desulfobacterales bacterium]